MPLSCDCSPSPPRLQGRSPQQPSSACGQDLVAVTLSQPRGRQGRGEGPVVITFRLRAVWFPARLTFTVADQCDPACTASLLAFRVDATESTLWVLLCSVSSLNMS